MPSVLMGAFLCTRGRQRLRDGGGGGLNETLLRRRRKWRASVNCFLSDVTRSPLRAHTSVSVLGIRVLLMFIVGLAVNVHASVCARMCFRPRAWLREENCTTALRF